MKRALTSILLTLALTAAAHALTPTDIKTENLTVTVDNQSFTLDPTTLKSATFDFDLKDGEPGWNGPTRLPGPAWVYGALRPETLTVTLASDANTKLTAGKDFALDPAWAAIAAVKDSKYPAGTKLHADYKYGLSRIDLIEKSPDGKLHLIKGTEHKTQPALPPTTAGNTPLFSVYLANGTTVLTNENINIIDPSYDGIPPVTSPELLAPIKQKLAEGKPVTIVFLGDSITEQKAEGMQDNKGSYIDRFAAWMKTAYPKSTVIALERGKPSPAPKDNQIIIAKAGVGGDDTPRTLKRLDKDVFAHKPDVVVVMLGVNDENGKDKTNSVPVSDYKKNIQTIVEKVQAEKAIPVLMTTSMKNLNWSVTVGNLNEYAQAMREVAADKKVPLDNFKAWEQLPKRGYNYMVYLGNCINHPVDLGHELFFQGLKSAFTDSKK